MSLPERIDLGDGVRARASTGQRRGGERARHSREPRTSQAVHALGDAGAGDRERAAGTLHSHPRRMAAIGSLRLHRASARTNRTCWASSVSSGPTRTGSMAARSRSATGSMPTGAIAGSRRARHASSREWRSVSPKSNRSSSVATSRTSPVPRCRGSWASRSTGSSRRESRRPAIQARTWCGSGSARPKTPSNSRRARTARSCGSATPCAVPSGDGRRLCTNCSAISKLQASTDHHEYAASTGRVARSSPTSPATRARTVGRMWFPTTA